MATGCSFLFLITGNDLSSMSLSFFTFVFSGSFSCISVICFIKASRRTSTTVTTTTSSLYMRVSSAAEVTLTQYSLYAVSTMSHVTTHYTSLIHKTQQANIDRDNVEARLQLRARYAYNNLLPPAIVVMEGCCVITHVKFNQSFQCEQGTGIPFTNHGQTGLKTVSLTRDSNT